MKLASKLTVFPRQFEIFFFQLNTYFNVQLKTYELSNVKLQDFSKLIININKSWGFFKSLKCSFTVFPYSELPILHPHVNVLTHSHTKENFSEKKKTHTPAKKGEKITL